MEFINSIKQVKSNWQPYKKWEQDQKDKDFQRQELYKKCPKSKEDLEKAAQYGRTLIDAINVMDQNATDKAQDVEMATNVLSQLALLPLFLVGAVIGFGLFKNSKVNSLLNKQPNLIKENAKQLFIAIPGICLAALATPFLKIKGAYYEKEAARIARYQSREEKLKDDRNFVIYDENQINEAKEIAKTLPDIPDKKKKKINPISEFNQAIQSVKDLKKDHSAYLNWKENHIKQEKIIRENLDNAKNSSEELQKAKNDQDNLLRTIKHIEINSQNYQSNAEMSLNSLLAFDTIFGVIAGGITAGTLHILQKIKVLSEKSNATNILKKSGPIAIPFILVIITSLYATKMQKEAARVGRFKAKQDLLKNPYNFVSYNDEQMNSVSDIKSPHEGKKSMLEKFKGYIKFLKQFKVDYKEYQQYLKTDYKEEQKLNEALKKINISDEQSNNAKQLQKNAFMSFEKMDEMSQRYVADVEAGMDTVKEGTSLGFNLLSQFASLGILLKMKDCKDKSKLINIFYPALVPIFAIIPIQIKSTQLQKQASKIGLMEAIQDLQDPRLFIQDKNKLNESKISKG